MTDAATPSSTSGTFAGISVESGSGLVSHPPVAGTVTHYHAAQLPELGDVVLAVARGFDPTTGAATGIELRAFAASAPGRGALANLAPDDFTIAPGAIAYAKVSLANPGDAADERRPAELVRCTVSDAAPTAEAARGVADWLRSTWETELAFGSWPAVRGTLDAFAGSTGGFASDWATEWLRSSEHRVGDEQPATFLKVLDAAWLEGSN